MQHSVRQWRATDRQQFLSHLTKTGNPSLAATAVGRTLAEAYDMRDRCPALANGWRRALGIAWEQVEMRLLATLLDGDGEIDPKVALEMLKRRAPVPARRGVTLDAIKVARVRDEIRALAAPE